MLAHCIGPYHMGNIPHCWQQKLGISAGGGNSSQHQHKLNVNLVDIHYHEHRRITDQWTAAAFSGAPFPFSPFFVSILMMTIKSSNVLNVMRW